MALISNNNATRELRDLECVDELINKLKSHYNKESEKKYSIYPERPSTIEDDLQKFVEQIFGIELKNTIDDDEWLEHMEKRMVIHALISNMISMMKDYTCAHDQLWNTEDGKREVDKIKAELAPLLPYMKQHSSPFSSQ